MNQANNTGFDAITKVLISGATGDTGRAAVKESLAPRPASARPGAQGRRAFGGAGRHGRRRGRRRYPGPEFHQRRDDGRRCRLLRLPGRPRPDPGHRLLRPGGQGKRRQGRAEPVAALGQPRVRQRFLPRHRPRRGGVQLVRRAGDSSAPHLLPGVADVSVAIALPAARRAAHADRRRPSFADRRRRPGPRHRRAAEKSSGRISGRPSTSPGRSRWTTRRWRRN